MPSAPMYTARVTNDGGTAGRVIIDDGPAVAATLPTGAPTPHGAGFNPEQFLAMAWSTCFGATLSTVLREHGYAVDGDVVDGDDAQVATSVTATVALHRDDAGGYRFVPRLSARVDGLEEAPAIALLALAHGRCPLSRLLRAGDDGEVVLETDAGERPLPA